MIHFRRQVLRCPWRAHGTLGTSADYRASQHWMNYFHQGEVKDVWRTIEYTWLGDRALWGQGLLWTSEPPAEVLGLQACTTTAGLHGAGDEKQSSGLARQTLYHMGYILRPETIKNGDLLNSASKFLLSKFKMRHSYLHSNLVDAYMNNQENLLQTMLKKWSPKQSTHIPNAGDHLF